MDITQKQAAVDRSRSQNNSNSVSSKLKTERQERAKVALTKSSPSQQPVATGPEKRNSDGNELARGASAASGVQAPKQKVVKSRSTGSTQVVACNGVNTTRSNKIHANSLGASTAQMEEVKKEVNRQKAPTPAGYSSLPQPSKSPRQPLKTTASPTDKLGDFSAGPTSFLSLLGPSPSDRRRESLNAGSDEPYIGRLQKGGRGQSPSPVPFPKKIVRSSNSAPITAAIKSGGKKTTSNSSSLPRRAKAATAPLPLARKSQVDQVKRSPGPKNVTMIKIGAMKKKKPSCGFLVMAADLRGRDTGGGVGDLVTSEVIVNSEKGLAATWLQLKEEMEVAMRRKPNESGARQYKDLALLLQVGDSSRNNSF